MLRRASTSLFCALALIAPAYGQEIFVPRELKATPVHPVKPKEVVRRAEPVTDAASKPAKEPASAAETTRKTNPQPETATVVKSEKTSPKEKAAGVSDQAPPKKVAKAEPAKEKAEKVAAPQEKPTATKTKVVTDTDATMKAERPAGKEPAPKTVAKTETTKERAASAREKSDNEIPTIKVEKTTASKEATTKPAAKTDIAKAEPAREKSVKPAVSKDKATGDTAAKTMPLRSENAVAKSEPPVAKEEPSHKSAAKSEGVKVETLTAKTEKPSAKEKPATVAASRTLRNEKSSPKEEAAKTDVPKPEVTVAKADKPAALKEKEKEKGTRAAGKAQIQKPEPLIAKVDPAPPREGPVNPGKGPTKSEPVSVPSQKDPPQIIPAVNGSLDMGFTKIADGFDFPVGKPEADGYYKARGFRSGGHLGEDWDGVGGGDTDLGDPIYCIGDGIVVFARDVHLGWGNVIIVRHAYRDNGNVRYVDSLYGHLNSMLVGRGQRVARGQQIATMGTAHGQYDAHLHLEIRKNLEIGMSRSKFQKDFSNYYDPTQFINSHRHLAGGGANYKVAMNTFTHDWAFHFDRNRDFGARKRSTGESSAALRQAITSR
ncbi:MAG TPA: peptidoglycan DD-metalloendopeptidase family protein [Chthoniobacterales bacterium]